VTHHKSSGGGDEREAKADCTQEARALHAAPSRRGFHVFRSTYLHTCVAVQQWLRDVFLGSGTDSSRLLHIESRERWVNSHGTQDSHAVLRECCEVLLARETTMRTSVDVRQLCPSLALGAPVLARVDYHACSKGRSFARMPVLAQGMQCLPAHPAAGGRHQGATVPKACVPCVARPQTLGFFSRPALLGRPTPGLQLRVAASRRRTLACVAVAAPAAPAVAATGAAYSTLSLGFPKETYHEEKRAAATPETVARLVKAGFGAVLVETGLGVGSGFADSAYSAAGAHLSAACALPAGLRCATRPVGLTSGRYRAQVGWAHRPTNHN